MIDGWCLDFCSLDYRPRRTRKARAPRRTDAEAREATIAAALGTEEGRAQLATAMVEPIRRSLDYQGIGRRLLFADPLPEAAMTINVTPEMTREMRNNSYDIRNKLSQNAIAEMQRTEDEDIIDTLSYAINVLVPTFEATSNPTIRLDEIRNRRFNLVAR